MKSAKAKLAGLYVITDHALMGEQLIQLAAQAIKGGAAIVQYRDKTQRQAAREQEAAALAELCHRHEVVLLINDDVELARKVGADGVHLGQKDMRLAEARKILGEDKIIGVTCHNSLDKALAAQRAGADYVAFGRFFASRTKPEAPPATLDILKQARAQLCIPIVAIGGVTPENGRQLIDAGADMLAAIHGIFAHADICAAARRYAALFKRAP